jgi:hypothetical protein
MDAGAIRQKMRELCSRVPRYYTGADRADFVDFVGGGDHWVDSGPLWLSVEHEEGIQTFRPALTYFTEDDYTYFKEKIDDDHIDKARLARDYLASIMALCGYWDPLWSDWALRRIGTPTEILQAFEGRPPEEIAAEVIQVVIAKREELEAEARKRRRDAYNPFGDWSFVRTPRGDFSLEPAAAKCFAVMADLEGRGLPLYRPHILKEAGISEDRRLDHVFRDSGAWGNLVRSTRKKSRRLEIVWEDDKTNNPGDGKKDD